MMFNQTYSNWTLVPNTTETSFDDHKTTTPWTLILFCGTAILSVASIISCYYIVKEHKKTEHKLQLFKQHSLEEQSLLDDNQSLTYDSQSDASIISINMVPKN